MTLGSLFDGIGGWPLAAIHAGVTPVWASEIDDFPAAVTAYHFPDMEQLGDITKINVDGLTPVDIICAGSPCQDLSVAGKREGLAGERSGLFRTAIDIVHRLRNRTGMPRYFVWENVPGAFSSNKGLDFRAVLEEITKTEIPMPANNKWAESGVVEWDGGSLAWRVLDAQYWGVPQRRKRIFLVADFAGHSAGEILFESYGLPRDSAESEGTRQENTADVGESVDSASGTLTPWDVQSNRIQSINGKAAALYGGAGQGTHNGAVFDIRHSDSAGGIGFREGSYGSFVADSVAGTSKASGGVLGGQRNPNQRIVGSLCACDYKGAGNQYVSEGNLCMEFKIIENHPNDSRVKYKEDGVFQTLSSRMGTGGGNVPMVHTIAGNIIGRDNKNGGHQLGIGHDVSPTLNTVDRHAVSNEKTVRRLTPTECERLQGLPDGYTDIEYKGKTAPDSKRYKALGNGMAQPCASWIIKRIVEVHSNE